VRRDQFRAEIRFPASSGRTTGAWAGGARHAGRQPPAAAAMNSCTMGKAVEGEPRRPAGTQPGASRPPRCGRACSHPHAGCGQPALPAECNGRAAGAHLEGGGQVELHGELKLVVLLHLNILRPARRTRARPGVSSTVGWAGRGRRGDPAAQACQKSQVSTHHPPTPMAVALIV
jgi:hypothetical protein